MSVFLNVLGVVLILSFLVFIHELGHFIAARRNGVKVEEFGMGFPPRLFSFKKGDTVYTFNLIPFGGFVKLYGEDTYDKRILNSKQSYASKTPWQKVKILTAGVFMNFLVFWICMTAAMTIGMDPMITNEDDFQMAFKDGTYTSEAGLYLEDGRKVVQVDETPVYSFEATKFLDGNEHEFVFDDGSTELGTVEDLDFEPVVSLPAIRITEISNESVLTELRPDDVITSIGGVPPFDMETLIASFYSNNDGGVEVKYLREGEEFSSLIEVNNYYEISGFTDDSVALKAGILEGDNLIAVDGLIVEVGDDPSKVVRDKGLEKVVYTIRRDGVDLDYVLRPNDEGLVGIALAPEFSLKDLSFDFVQDSVLSSVTDIEQIKEPIYRAPITALSEGTKIAVMTAGAFLKTFSDVATKLEVSDDIGGPVQVAKLGFVFVQEGGVELLSFIALISLSLAVINILPIPALDGGRLVFVIIEAFRGKPLNSRIEAMIHTAGFIFLLLLIAVVTFYDIVRI